MCCGHVQSKNWPINIACVTWNTLVYNCRPTFVNQHSSANFYGSCVIGFTVAIASLTSSASAASPVQEREVVNWNNKTWFSRISYCTILIISSSHQNGYNCPWNYVRLCSNTTKMNGFHSNSQATALHAQPVDSSDISVKFKYIQANKYVLHK